MIWGGGAMVTEINWNGMDIASQALVEALLDAR